MSTINFSFRCIILQLRLQLTCNKWVCASDDFRSICYDHVKVFADMEELGVKPDFGTVKRVSKIYADFGYPEYAQSLWKKYPFDSEGKFVRKERPSRGPGREGTSKSAHLT